MGVVDGDKYMLRWATELVEWLYSNWLIFQRKWVYLMGNDPLTHTHGPLSMAKTQKGPVIFCV